MILNISSLNLQPEYYTILLFILTAIGRTLLDVVIWKILVFLIGVSSRLKHLIQKLGLNKYSFAQIIAFSLSMVVSYILNYSLVFSTSATTQILDGYTLFKFIVVTIFSLVVSVWFINFFTQNQKVKSFIFNSTGLVIFEKLSQPLTIQLQKHWPLLVKLASIGLTMFTNFCGYYFWVFA